VSPPASNCQNVTNTIYSQFLGSVHTYRAPVQSCTTPPASQNLPVPLGMYHASEFTGNHTTQPKPFTFTVNCPEGYNSIRYWVGSPFRVASDPDENTYAVPGYVVNKGFSPPNQAAALALINRNGDAPDYGQPRQDYQITLKAALYQTEPTITPGPFKTHILIYMVYK